MKRTLVILFEHCSMICDTLVKPVIWQYKLSPGPGHTLRVQQGPLFKGDLHNMRISDGTHIPVCWFQHFNGAESCCKAHTRAECFTYAADCLCTNQGYAAYDGRYTIGCMHNRHLAKPCHSSRRTAPSQGGDCRVSAPVPQQRWSISSRQP